MDDYVKVAKLEDIPRGVAVTVHVGVRTVALFNVEGTLYATDNSCHHLGGPLGEGSLKGSLVTCPWHDWQYDVRNGACLQSGSLFLKVFDVKVEKGEIYVAAQPKVRGT